jgi:hypothetical protein
VPRVVERVAVEGRGPGQHSGVVDDDRNVLAALGGGGNLRGIGDIEEHWRKGAPR